METLATWATAKELTQSDLGQLSGLGRDRVGRLMRGEIWMRLEDATALGSAVGVCLLTAAQLCGDGLLTAWQVDTPAPAEDAA